MLQLSKKPIIPEKSSQAFIISKEDDLTEFGLTSGEIQFVQNCINNKKFNIELNKLNYWIFIHVIDESKNSFKQKENARCAAFNFYNILKDHKIQHVAISGSPKKESNVLAFAEGLLFSCYDFIKYFKNKEEKETHLQNIDIVYDSIDEKEVEQLNVVSEAVTFAKNLVNEPPNFLTASVLADEIRIFLKTVHISVETFNKAKLESLKMGGILAVNRGSSEEPRFIIAEWKPEKAVNLKPVVLVGKGITFDSGGMNLKPTMESLETMKSDMAGAATVAATIFSLAALNCPVYCIALIPSTDNKLDANSYAPGDIVSMHNGLNVEINNTDAEGRLILADALSYAQKYEPELVIDVATLTGSAAALLGKEGSVLLGNASKNIIDHIIHSGYEVHERLVELPTWEEFDDMLKSDVADLKNSGGKFAGAITAAKFLERFTNYPWIHLDIAGTAFNKSSDSYRGKGASGSGVRLLTDFLFKFAVEFPFQA